jgi:peptidoglycan/LPS O-acetylase OafA/YrhL
VLCARWPRLLKFAFLILGVSPILRVLNQLRRTSDTRILLGHYHAIPVIEFFDIFVILGFAAYAFERWGASLGTGAVDDKIGRRVGAVVRRTPLSVAIGVEVAGEFVMERTGNLVAIALVPTVHAIVLAILALKLVLGVERGIVARLLELRPLKYLGLISYSLYLTNPTFLTYGAPDILGLGLQVFPLSWAAAIGLSSANYHWFEEPMRRRIRRLLLPRRRTPASTECPVTNSPAAS